MARATGATEVRDAGVVGCQMVVKAGIMDNALSTCSSASNAVQIYAVVVTEAQIIFEPEALFLVEGLAVVEVGTYVPVAIDVDGLGGGTTSGLVVDHAGGYSVIGVTVPEIDTHGPYLGSLFACAPAKTCETVPSE